MSAGAQINWDEQPNSAVKWDDAAPSPQQEPWYERFPRAALHSLGLPESISDVPRWATQGIPGLDKSATSVLPQHAEDIPIAGPMIQAAKNPTEENLVNAVPFIGPPSVAAAHSFGEGDYASGLGHLAAATAPAIAPAGAELAGRAVDAVPQIGGTLREGATSLKNGIGTAARTEKGALKPILREGSRLAGGLVGHAAQVPGGELIGAVMGPTVADAIIPNRPMPEIGSPENPGWHAALPVRMPKQAPPALPEPELGSPENPGWHSKIPTRMPKKAPEVGGPTAPAPRALIAGPTEEPSGTDIISRTKRLVLPGEEPTALDLKRAGDLTQAPLSRLQTLAKFGDKLAQNELNRRLKQ